MARPLRIEVRDGIHHAMSRGINRRDIFTDDQDRSSFLLQLKDCLVRFEWRCLAFCLMPNHFHVLLRTPRANLGTGMRDLKSGYATTFNQRHGRSGPLFESRYKSRLVQDDAYMLAVARYIALNPVRAGLVRRPEDWRWSFMRELVDGTVGVVDNRDLLATLASDHGQARSQFLDLVADGAGLPAYDPSKPIFGERSFVERHAPRELTEAPVTRDVWNQARPPLSELLEVHSGDRMIHEARNTYRYTIKEIAAACGCSTETVRRRLNVGCVDLTPR